MLGKGLVNRAVATLVAAGAAFVTVIALGATGYYALLLVVTPLAASAITAGVFALITLVVTLVYLKKGKGDENHNDEDDEPEGLSGRALRLFADRPVLGTVAALAGGFLVLRNPAIASLAMTMLVQKTQKSRRRSR
jgi:membrane protein implicated in regulation of membrane protease activity